MNAPKPCRPRGNGNQRLTRRRIVGLFGAAACAFALCVQALPAATVVHRPYLQNLAADHVTIVWSARDNQSATVQYSTDASFSQSAPVSVRVLPAAQTDMGFTLYQYQSQITGLAPGTAYSYRVTVGGENITPESDHRFSTPGPGPFSFLVFGDSGDGSSHQLATTLQMVTEQPNFVIHVGDIAYQNGTFNEFTANYFEYYKNLMRRACFFAIAGNHEYYTQNAAPFLSLHAPPTDTVPFADLGHYYSFDWGNIHFVGLDANLLDVQFPAARARMLAWLESDLTNSQAAWKVAFFHQTPYPIAQHVDDVIDIAAREQFVPILERHGVQLVLAGHEHSYQRSKPMRGGIPVASGAGTVYMVSGGGGGVLHPVSPQSYLDQEFSVWHYLKVEVDGPKLTIHAIGTDGKEFDRLVLNQPSLDGSGAVVNGASFTTDLASGGFVTIFGQGLAAGTSQASNFPLPVTLAGTSVTLNNTPMALTYVSAGQINAVLPLDALGPGTLRVTTPAGFAETHVTVSDTAPAIFPFAITHVNGTLVSPAAQATPGETLIIYMTGLGQVDGRISTGQPAPSSPLLKVLGAVQVQIGDLSVAPDFAGLTPGLVGVYQVNVVVPQSLPTKVYPLRVSEKGNISNPQNIQLLGHTP